MGLGELAGAGPPRAATNATDRASLSANHTGSTMHIDPVAPLSQLPWLFQFGRREQRVAAASRRWHSAH